MRHGFNFDRQSTRRISDVVQKVEEGVRDSTEGARPRERPPAPIILALISGGGPGGLYNGTQQVWNGSGFEALTDGRVWSTSTDSLGQLQEMNGNENIASGTFVKVFAVGVPQSGFTRATNAGEVTWFFESVDVLEELGEGSCGTIEPRDVADIFSEHQADAITGVNAGSPLTTWTDTIGSQNFTESTNKPTYNTGQCGGLPGVTFDGVNDRLSSSSVSAYNFLHNGSPFTMFFAFKITGFDGSGFAHLFGNQSGGAPGDAGIFVFWRNDFKRLGTKIFNTTAGVIEIDASTDTVPVNKCVVLALRHIPGNIGTENDYEWFVSGVRDTGKDPRNPHTTVNASFGMVMGVRFLFTDRHLDGNYNANITYKRALSDLEICKISKNLAKYT